MKGWNSGYTRRVFLTGANPFVLSYDKLTAIAELIHEHLPSVKSFGSFARITDVTPKTNEELTKLWTMGFDGLTIGIETGWGRSWRNRSKIDGRYMQSDTPYAYRGKYAYDLSRFRALYGNTAWKLVRGGRTRKYKLQNQKI